MKTLAEVKGRKPFDWNAFFKQKTYTDKELNAAKLLACNWVTCACGNQCAIIPRGTYMSSKEPTDYNLRMLGLSFTDMVSNMNANHNNKKEFNVWKKRAILILKKIEKRSAVLVAKEIELINTRLSFAGYTIKKLS